MSRRLRRGPLLCRNGGRRSRRRPASARDRGTSLCRSTPIAAEQRPSARPGLRFDRLAIQRGHPPRQQVLLGRQVEHHRRLDGVGTASYLPGSYDRSQDPDDREGRRTLGPCPKWHMDVPRPFVKTGRRPEGWDMGPGCGGPVRSRRFNRGKRPLGEPRLQQGTATPSGTDVSTGYDRPCKAPAPCAADQRPLPERK